MSTAALSVPLPQLEAMPKSPRSRFVKRLSLITKLSVTKESFTLDSDTQTVEKKTVESCSDAPKDIPSEPSPKGSSLRTESPLLMPLGKRGNGLAQMLTQVMPPAGVPLTKDPLPALASTPTPPRSPNQESFSNSSPFRIRKKGSSLLWQTQPDVDLQRLALFRQQPKNLSPADPNGPTYLPPPMPSKADKPLLVLDLDETLVHASFSPGKPYNLKITITVDGETGDIFVAYRPHMMTFLKVVSSLFEVAVFTASQRCYAEQLMDHIDPNGTIVGRNRLYRDHCTNVSGANVKDLSRIGRPLGRVAIIDNSPVAYLFQPRNAIPILSWFDDPNDTELLKLIPLLRQLASVNEVYDVLDVHNCTKQSPPNSPSKLSRG